MNIVHMGSKYMIYGNDLTVGEKLPAKTYTVMFEKMSGFSLSEAHDIKANEDEIYGGRLNKTEKVLKSFETFDRNLGIILSGDKGIGKSLFARILCEEAIKKGHPVVIVNEYIPGIASFLESIEQEIVVLFDEFDKTFVDPDSEDNTAPQTEMLSLFDGISTSKKMFIITCNKIKKLSDYMINRPGRFHYHFRFDYPTADEIEVYLRDKIDEKYYPEIKEVVNFSYKVKLNYDCLRAIAFELNSGEKFSEAIKDLNIVNVEDRHYSIALHFKEGAVFTKESVVLDFFSPSKGNFIGLRDKEGKEYLGIVNYDLTRCIFGENGNFILPADAFTVNYEDYYDDFKKEVTATKKMTVDHLEIKQVPSESLHFMV